MWNSIVDNSVNTVQVLSVFNGFTDSSPLWVLQVLIHFCDCKCKHQNLFIGYQIDAMADWTPSLPVWAVSNFCYLSKWKQKMTPSQQIRTFTLASLQIKNVFATFCYIQWSISCWKYWNSVIVKNLVKNQIYFKQYKNKNIKHDIHDKIWNCILQIRHPLCCQKTYTDFDDPVHFAVLETWLR